MPENGPTNGRVTNAQLQLELNLVRQEQKTEHWKTRGLVVLLGGANLVKAIPLVAGYLFGWHPW